MFGIIEIGFGIVIFLYIKSTKPPDETKPPEKVEVATTMDDIRVQGGVDPQYMSTLQRQITYLGYDPNRIISDPKDQVKSQAELIQWVRSYEDPKMNSEIVPPPAPNTPSAVLLVRERLKNPSESLKGKTPIWRPTVFLKTR